MTQAGAGGGRLASWGRLVGPLAGLALALAIWISTGTLSPAGKVAALATTMAVLWMTEAVPLAATALLPLVLFPLLGVASSREAAVGYADPAIFLFLGGFLIARVVEDTGLHRRIAIGIVGAVGERPRQLVLGFMLTAALLSMWISNTATALVLLPVVLAVTRPALERGDAAGRTFATALLLGTAYGASIGGVATPVGSPPNIIFLAQLRAAYPDLEIGFARWMMLGLPFVALFLPLAWWWLCRGLDPRAQLGEGTAALAEARGRLGPMSRDEKLAAALFAVAGLGWIFRSSIHIGPLNVPGWADLFGGGKVVHDAVVALAVALVAFFLPSAQRPGERLLTWSSASKIAWGLLLLFGGGIALARGFQSSGLSAALGGMFQRLEGAPILLLVVLLTLAVVFLTELTSNTATTTVMMPILAALALALHVSPMLVMLPAALAASCAFMLPVATPPNAVVFSSGAVPLRDMLRAGLFLNLVGTVLITALVMLLGPMLPSS